MKFAPFRSIGGLTIRIFNDDDQPRGNGRIAIDVPKEALNLLAIETLREMNGIGYSEELINICKQMVALDFELKKQGGWEILRDDIKSDLIETQMDTIRDDLKGTAVAQLEEMTLREIAADHIMAYNDQDDSYPTDEQIEQWIELNKKVP